MDIPAPFILQPLFEKKRRDETHHSKQKAKRSSHLARIAACIAPEAISSPSETDCRDDQGHCHHHSPVIGVLATHLPKIDRAAPPGMAATAKALATS